MTTLATGLATSFINFSRPGASGGGATVTDADGKIKWAGHNLLTNSESFDASAWVKANVTISANAAVAPNGTTTADTVTLGAGTAGKYVYQTRSPLGAQTTMACYVKIASGTVRYIQLLQNNDVQAYANFDITGNATGSKGTNTPSSAITSIGSDWYYITATFAGSGDTPFIQIVDGTSSGYSPTTTATGTLHLWGAHLYRSDMQMQLNPAQPAGMQSYYPTTPRNLLGYTEDFSNAAWVKSNILAFGSGSVANAVIAPNGLQTADLITESTVNGLHGTSQSSVVSSGATVTFSVYIKKSPAGRDYAAVYITDGVAKNYPILVNLNDGTFVNYTGIADYAAPTSTSVTPVGDGWYRCRVTVALDAARTSCSGVVLLRNSGTVSASSGYTGDGTSGIYLWGAQLSDSASLDTYVPVYGAAVTSAAYYAPRLDFDPVTLAAKGLLVEEARTNLVVNSAAFNETTWVKTSQGSGSVPTVTADAGASPSGDNTADRVQFSRSGTALSDRSRIDTSSISVSTSTNYTFSVWMKSYDGSNQTVALIPNFGTGEAVAVTVTNVWQRFSVSANTSAGTTALVNIGLGYVTNSVTNADVLIWGAQLEAGSFATSYIPTGSATATRTADVASVSTQAFPYSSSEGTLVANGSPLSSVANTNQVIAELGDGGATNIFEMYRVSGGTNGALYVASGGVGSTITLSNAFPANAASKFGGVYKANDFQAAANGALGTPVTSGAVPTAASNLYIGRYGGGSNNTWNGHIRQITYLPRRISNAELQSRTA